MPSSIRIICSLCLICTMAVHSFKPVSYSINSRLQSKPSASVKLFSSSPRDTTIGNVWNMIKTSKFVKGSMLAFFAAAQIANARPEGVNRPDLLPKELNVPLIDVANFLSKGQEKKIVASIGELQKATGWKLRILCQRYFRSECCARSHLKGVIFTRRSAPASLAVFVTISI
jgi:hypothetical protein